MQEINITELRKHLPSYLKRVALGEQIRVTSNGKVRARIVPEGDPGSAARWRHREPDRRREMVGR